MAHLPPLADMEEAELAAEEESTDLEHLLRVRAPHLPCRAPQTIRLMRAMAAAKPIPRVVWGGDPTAVEDDEVEEVAASIGRAVFPPGAGDAIEAVDLDTAEGRVDHRAGDAIEPIERLRESTLGGKTITPFVGQALEGRRGDLRVSVDSDNPGGGVFADLQVFDDSKLPELSPPPYDPDMQFDDNDDNSKHQSGAPMDDAPGSAAAVPSGVLESGARAQPDRETNEGILLTQGPDGSQSMEDNSLSAHTVATLSRLEHLAVVHTLSCCRAYRASLQPLWRPLLLVNSFVQAWSPKDQNQHLLMDASCTGAQCCATMAPATSFVDDPCEKCRRAQMGPRSGRAQVKATCC
jgi:hypothetical protein